MKGKRRASDSRTAAGQLSGWQVIGQQDNGTARVNEGQPRARSPLPLLALWTGQAAPETGRTGGGDRMLNREVARGELGVTVMS